jgi:hypothetical protein
VEYDRKVKADHYASAGIPEYWLVDLSGGSMSIGSPKTTGTRSASATAAVISCRCQRCGT